MIKSKMLVFDTELKRFIDLNSIQYLKKKKLLACLNLNIKKKLLNKNKPT